MITSLKPRSEIYSRTPDLWPSDPQWHQYPRVLGEGHVGRALMNSLIVAGATTVICLIVGALAAYALTRFDIPFQRVLMMLVLMTQMFPLVVLVIPLFVIMRNADLLGTYVGLIVAYLAFTVPLAVWVMRGFLVGIPEELEHAARTDGATRLGAMWRVMLPLAAPGLATTAVLCFLEGWKEFMLALTFMNEETRKTLPVVIQTLRRPRRHRLGRDHGRQRDLHAAGRARLHPPAQAPDARHDGRGGEGMRLGVEAALVDGALVPGRRRGRRRHDRRRRARPAAAAGVAAPGFVDLQVNGFAGVDFMHTDRDGYARAGEAMLATGTTAYQPTFITAPEADLVAALREIPLGERGRRARASSARTSRARSSRRGGSACTRRRCQRAPDPALLDRILDAGGGAPDDARARAARRVRADRPACWRAASSSRPATRDASAAEAHLAFDRGVRTVTHLFNAMRPLVPRDPGIALAALARPDVTIQLIADLHHVAGDTLLVAWRAARGRIALVTDAVAATAMGDGDFALAGPPARVRRGRRARAGGAARRQRADDDRRRAQRARARRSRSRRR